MYEILAPAGDLEKLKMLLLMTQVNNKCRLMAKKLCSVEQIVMKLH